MIETSAIIISGQLFGRTIDSLSIPRSRLETAGSASVILNLQPVNGLLTPILGDRPLALLEGASVFSLSYLHNSARFCLTPFEWLEKRGGRISKEGGEWKDVEKGVSYPLEPGAWDLSLGQVGTALKVQIPAPTTPKIVTQRPLRLQQRAEAVQQNIPARSQEPAVKVSKETAPMRAKKEAEKIRESLVALIPQAEVAKAFMGPNRTLFCAQLNLDPDGIMKSVDLRTKGDKKEPDMKEGIIDILVNRAGFCVGLLGTPKTEDVLLGPGDNQQKVTISTPNRTGELSLIRELTYRDLSFMAVTSIIPQLKKWEWDLFSWLLLQPFPHPFSSESDTHHPPIPIQVLRQTQRRVYRLIPTHKPPFPRRDYEELKASLSIQYALQKGMPAFSYVSENAGNDIPDEVMSLFEFYRDLVLGRGTEETPQ